jgi:hypothetical protein
MMERATDERLADYAVVIRFVFVEELVGQGNRF